MTKFLSYWRKWKNNFYYIVKYFLLTIIFKIIKDFLILYDNSYINEFIIFKTPASKSKI